MKFEEFKEHFDEKISSSIVKYVTNTVLKDSRYLFYKTVAGVQFAHCTHCNTRHRSEAKLRHKQEKRVVCPHCKSKCHVRSAGISRKRMVDQAVLVWYEKSVCNPKAVTARVISVYRDYSGDFRNVQTMYNCSDMYLFSSGKSYYYKFFGKWELRKTVFSAFDKGTFGNSYPRFRSNENIRKAVKGTPLQYSMWEKYLRYKNHMYVSDMVEFFDLACKYPCVEYLTKLGFSDLVWPKLYGSSSLGAINWRGKTLEKVLRLTKAEIKEIHRKGLKLDPTKLKFIQDLRRKEIKLPIDMAYIMSDLAEYHSRKPHMNEILKYTNEESAMEYLAKQIRNKHFVRASTALSDWKDYIQECRELGKNLKLESVLFPNNLKAAHRETMKQLKSNHNPELDAKIRYRLTELEKYRFDNQEFLLRPVESSLELLLEGKELLHCVNTYAHQYAEGRTNIFVIRKKACPELPYYTMEFINGRIVQCRGFDNCDMTDEVAKFVQKFMEYVKTLKKRRSDKPNKEAV